MKHTNIAKRVLACGLAVAMVVTGADYSSVNVSAARKSKAKKTKAKLSKKKASITAGGTVTLKVKKASKKVKWSTSNKKVAKITKTSGKKKSTAKILGVKKGKAVITAKVGKKKLKCKVTVKASKIKSVSVDKLDHSSLTVKFTKKTSLNADGVKIAVKEYNSGKYNQNPKVEALSTADQKTYRLYLTSSISDNAYVKVKVGKFTKEIQNKQKFYIDEDAAPDGAVTVLLEKESLVQKLSLDEYFCQNVGDISYSLKKGSKLPKGLSLVGKRGLLKGIPSTAGVTETSLIAKDEAGRKLTLKVTFKVYDDVTIAAADSLGHEIKLDDYMVSLNASKLATAVPAATANAGTIADAPVASAAGNMSAMKSASSISAAKAASPSVVTAVPVPIYTAKPSATSTVSDYYAKYDITPEGGSRSYKYDLGQTADTGVKLSTDVTDANNQVTKVAAQSSTLYIPYGLAAGDHTYTVTVTDAADATRTTTVTVSIKVTEAFNISGTVKDTLDNLLSGNEKIYFYPADAENSGDYVFGRTFIKYTEQTDGKDVLTGGNHANGYGGTRSYTSCVNGDYYYAYTQSYTSAVGPYPRPTVLTETPTPAPSDAVAAATAAPNPSATGYTIADIAAGNYAAEVPAGTYTVKVSGSNGVRYQLDGKVTVAADAVGTTNLTMPVRFANVKATAKFANDKPVAGDYVYFETDNTKYEGWTLCALTDYQGVFTASLPAGTYHMYWLDENDQRQYCETPITVQDGTNAELGDLKLSVSRFAVTGTFKKKTQSYEYSNGSYTMVEKEEPADEATLRIYNANGHMQSVTTAENGTYTRMLDNGTYTVRYGSVTVGTVTVNGADVTQDFVYDSASTAIPARYANATALTLEQETVLQSTGNNDLLVKFTIPAAAQTSTASAITSSEEEYDISVTLNDGQSMPNSITIYEETTTTVNGAQTASASWYDSVSSSNGKVELEQGKTYMMNVTPIDDDQIRGNVTVKVSKHLQAYEKSSTAVTFDGNAVSLVCAKNVQDTDLQYKAYAKVSVEQGKTYTISYASKTIGTEDLSVQIANSGMTYNVSRKSGSEAGYADGAGEITFTASQSGDVYIAFTTSDTFFATIDVKAAVVQ